MGIFSVCQRDIADTCQLLVGDVGADGEVDVLTNSWKMHKMNMLPFLRERKVRMMGWGVGLDAEGRWRRVTNPRNSSENCGN